jgi:manganese/iron transport system permease protein
VPSPVDLIEVPFLRTAVVELALLSVAGGVLGAWVVLRRLAFFTHAAGSVAFPALVASAPLGIGPQVAGLAAGAAYAAGVGGSARSRRDPAPATALLLVAALALGVVLASDLVDSRGGVDRLLFGTILGLSPGDLAMSAAVAVLAVAGTLLGGRVWLREGFDDRAEGPRSGRDRAVDASLPLLVAVGAVAAVPAVGALLVTALFAVPAATARRLSRSIPTMAAAAVGLGLAQGIVGLYLAYALDISPGPAIATLGAAVYMAVVIGGAVRRRARRPAGRGRTTTEARGAPA